MLHVKPDGQLKVWYIYWAGLPASEELGQPLGVVFAVSAEDARTLGIGLVQKDLDEQYREARQLGRRSRRRRAGYRDVWALEVTADHLVIGSET